jgi:hypothetical protein
MRLPIAPLLAALCLTATFPAHASTPEELEQLEPGGGEWQVEYYGLVADDDEDGHSVQVLYGISDRLAVGGEIETGWSGGRLELEGFAPTILYTFKGAEGAGIGVGVAVEAELDDRLRFSGAEARLILEKRNEQWWGQADLIIGHEREDGSSGQRLAYGWAVNRNLGGELWAGLEASGQIARFGEPGLLSPAGHFVGPALTLERGSEEGMEAEIGIAWLRRFAGDGPANSARIFVQLSF